MSVTYHYLSFCHIIEIYFIHSFREIDVCNFTDDTTPYVCNQNLQVVIEKN